MRKVLVRLMDKKLLNKIKFVILSLSIILILSQELYAGQIKVYINGKHINLSLQPQKKNGRILIPLREIFAHMKVNVRWDYASQNIIITTEDKEIKFRINFKQAIINGERAILDVPAVRIKGDVFVPLRFISESLGARVNWNKGNKSISIEYENIEKNISKPKKPLIKSIYPQKNEVIRKEISSIYILFDLKNGSMINEDTIFFALDNKFISKKLLFVTHNVILYKLQEKLSSGKHTILIKFTDKNKNKAQKLWKFWIVR